MPELEDLNGMTVEQTAAALDQQLTGSPALNAGWDDLSAPIAAARLDTSSGRLDYDLFNGGVNFNSNARYPDEPALFPVQNKHAMLYGAATAFQPKAVARPHFHWLQLQAAIPNILLLWKFTNYGFATTFETDWLNYEKAIPFESVFTYPGSGTFAQITKFPEIDTSSLTLSSSIDYVLFRDSGNVSGMFAGADPVGDDVTLKFYDCHVQFNQERGSQSEFNKIA